MFNKFSPSEAAVSIFEFAKLHSKYVMRYSLIYGAFQVVTILLLAGTGYFGMLQKFIAVENANPSEDEILKIFASVNWFVFAIMIIVSIAFGIMITAMALRKTVNNTEKGFYGLSWGKDENNILLGSLVIGLIYVGSVFVAGVAGGIAGAAGSVGEYIVPVIMALITVFLIWFVVSISQFGVVTIANGRFSIKETFAETKVQFWSYMGAYVLAFVLAMIGSLVVQGSLGAIFGMSSFNPEAAQKLLPQSLSAALNPKFILYYFLMGVFSGFINLAFICVGSYIYHKKREDIEMAPNLPIKDDKSGEEPKQD